MRTELLQTFNDRPLAVLTHGLTKRYRRKVALDGLDLAVPEGAVYILVGPNGAGKTTALRSLLDLVRPDAGDATVFGLAAAAEGPAVRARIGYVPEAHDFAYPGLTAGRLLTHHARYFPGWDEAYATDLVRRLDVALEARVRDLSKGQARRVQLILALAHRPPLLLLDEPTDGLDPLARDQVFALLADHLAGAPTTVLVSTHRVHEVEGLGDHLGVLRNGRLVAQLERDLLARRLHRVRAEVPPGWAGAPEVEAAAVGRGRESPAGREVLWTVWGDAAEIAERLRGSGATVRALDPLNLEAAALALLAMEDRRP
jgi:ABC-type multidrug transport system ATPase subunit